MDLDRPPIHNTRAVEIFVELGLTLQQVRQDRILDEARETADPVHLMRLFGISDTTAMKYIHSAHPHRTTKLPR
ncbi:MULTISPECIES: hypothetical protein [unclassified Kitasatospora]|uniref:hypothetical protein n=1 Tax=unclassified Kitasatospora TaxID=2633591 RepID=UPI00070B54CC|nr:MULTISPECIES: hypothetical protein [unclassified Kitasatospora]KQV20972.1 hypothetical protein ASC99_20955 [Kitasatospora sp. Root107]KRB60375.1 hypothetical protein ASE03_12220 [Kitasatospora sp. Root187]